MSARCCLPVSILACLLGGCVEILAALNGSLPQNGGGTSPLDGDGGTPVDGPDGDLPVVTLTVSNPNPMINEEVLLRCSPAGGTGTGLTYAFQPAGLLVGINPGAGTAAFIPSEADAGTEFSFTCTAANEAGTSDPSNRQVIIPTGSG